MEFFKDKSFHLIRDGLSCRRHSDLCRVSSWGLARGTSGRKEVEAPDSGLLSGSLSSLLWPLLFLWPQPPDFSFYFSVPVLVTLLKHKISYLQLKGEVYFGSHFSPQSAGFKEEIAWQRDVAEGYKRPDCSPHGAWAREEVR